MSPFPVEFLNQTQPTFLLSQGSQYRHRSGTTPKAHTRLPPTMKPSRKGELSLPFPEEHCSHRCVSALLHLLPFAACLPRSHASCLQLHVPAPLLLAVRNPSLPCTPAGADPCLAAPNTLNLPCRGRRLSGRDYTASSQCSLLVSALAPLSFCVSPASTHLQTHLCAEKIPKDTRSSSSACMLLNLCHISSLSCSSLSFLPRWCFLPTSLVSLGNISKGIPTWGL